MLQSLFVGCWLLTGKTVVPVSLIAVVPTIQVQANMQVMDERSRICRLVALFPFVCVTGDLELIEKKKGGSC